MLKPAFRLVGFFLGFCVPALLSSGAQAQRTISGSGLVYAFDKDAIVLRTTDGQYYDFRFVGDYKIDWYRGINLFELTAGDVISIQMACGSGLEVESVRVYRNQPQDFLHALLVGSGPDDPAPCSQMSGVFQSLRSESSLSGELHFNHNGRETVVHFSSLATATAISPATFSDIGAGHGIVRVTGTNQPDGSSTAKTVELHFNPASQDSVAVAVAAANDVTQHIGTATSEAVAAALDGLVRLQGSSSQQSGEVVLNAFSTLLSALDQRVNGSGETLSATQKEGLRQDGYSIMQYSMRFLEDETIAFRPAVVRDIGQTITSMLNLGAALTWYEADLLQRAADAQSDPNATLEQQLSTAIRIAPTNKALIALNALAATMGPAIPNEELNAIRGELAQAINPADLRAEGLSGDVVLANAFAKLFPEQDTDMSFDPLSGVVHFSLPASDHFIAVRVTSMSVVGESFPEGIQIRADGSLLLTGNRLAAATVPAPYDPIAFYADAGELGRVSMDERGVVTIDAGDFVFAASFDFGGVGFGPAQNGLSYQLPTWGDESNQDYIISVTYGDGITQRLQPFVAAQGLFASLAARDLPITVDRNTGIIHMNGASFRPSYFIAPLAQDAQTQAFWNANKDAQGMAYREGDFNGDGHWDYEVISSLGSQVVYAVS